MMSKIEHSVDVNVPVHVAYSQLARFTEFPRFMEGVQEVRQLDNTHLHWRTQHGGETHEWESEITEQIPDLCIAWHNTSGRKNRGRVVLKALNGNCTRVTMSMEVHPDGGSAAVQDAAHDISARTERDLSRFKKFIEHTQETGGDRQAAPAGGQQNPSGTESRAGTTEMEAGQAGSVPWLPGLAHLWEEPFYVMRRMTNEMDHFFERLLGSPRDAAEPTGARNWTPAVEVARRDNELIISADLPGIKREDVQVKVQYDRVTIEGDRPELSGEQTFHQTDRAYGHFYREIPLPEEVDSDSAAAFMDEGVLRITLPVAPPEKLHGRRLDIQSRSG